MEDKSKNKIAKKWKDLLWNGNIKGLYDSIKNTLNRSSCEKN